MEQTRELSHVLDELEEALHGESVAVEEITRRLGRQSFASVMLIFSLISTSPASGIPGVTTMVAAIVFILVVQMLLGRDCVWLPRFVQRRHLSTVKLRKGLVWLRGPVRFVERFLRPRLTVLLTRPWILAPLALILALTLFMPVMEVIPLSGSLASAVIATFAAGFLTRDGALVVVSLILLIAVPLTAWQFGFGG